MRLRKSEVRCAAHGMAHQAMEAIKEHFKEYPTTKPDRDALCEALTDRWRRENLIVAFDEGVGERSAVIATHARWLHNDHPQILAFYKALDERTAGMHVDKEELQKELKLNTPLLHRDWAKNEMEAWYVRSLAKLYRTPDFCELMAKPAKIDVDMYEASTCLDPRLSDDEDEDDDDDEDSDSDSGSEERGEEEMTSEEEDESAESEEDDDGSAGSAGSDGQEDPGDPGDPAAKRARREESDGSAA